MEQKNMAIATPPHSPVFNLPNQLTAARLVLAVVLFGRETGTFRISADNPEGPRSRRWACMG